MHLTEYLQEQTKYNSSSLAVIEVESGNTITYEQLWNGVNRFASQLINLGITRFDRVGLALPNSIDWLISFFAILKCGGVVVPFRHSIPSFEAKRLIQKTKPTMFIGDSSFLNRSLPFNLIDDGRRVLIINTKKVRHNKNARRINDLNNLIANSSQNSSRSLPSVNIYDTATINTTYRDYGYPLGAMLSHSNYIEGIKAYIHSAGFERPHRFLATLPFCHTYPLIGCILAPLATNSTIISYNGISPYRIWEIIDQYKIEVLTAIPPLYSALISSSSTHKINDRITHAFCGGSVMSIELYNQVKNRMKISLRQGYGLTECLPVTGNPSDGNRPETLGKSSVGSIGLDVKIFNHEGTEKLIGEVGEIVVTGPTVMKGYFNSPLETDLVLKNGWLYTGDLGWLDSDGYLHFSGVKKRIAKVGGNLVDLSEVEVRTMNISGICNVKAYAVPDRRWGEVVAADIITTNNSIDIRTIQSYLRRYLASYKHPKTIRIL